MVRPLATLNLDIIDYPGEWLLDLPLVEAEYEAWSRETLALARLPPRAAVARDWLDFIGAHPPAEPASEDTARAAAELYTVYLRRCREELGLSLLQPGRFLSPGEFEGAPVLWFCPLDVEGAAPRPGSLHALMRERFEGYREHVVRGFYRDHFRRFDRQAVLVDVLHALDAGQAAFDDARAALQAVMESFRFGRSSFLSALLGARIDKVVFLATNADHVAPSQYENLRLLLERMMSAASLEVRFKGGEVQTRAVAAVRCTEAGMGSFQGRQVGMVRGIPVGESQPRVLFSGEVPPAPPPPEAWTAQRPDFPRFRPPRIDVDAFRGIPQIGLDEALQSLIGDKLA
jgi:predicted YcjX-like family ATPase